MRGAVQSSRVLLATWNPALLYMAAAVLVSATCIITGMTSGLWLARWSPTAYAWHGSWSQWRWGQGIMQPTALDKYNPCLVLVTAAQ